MFYTTLKHLILPPGALILLLLIGFLLVRRTLGRLLIFVGISVFTLLSLPIVAQGLTAGLEHFPALAPEALHDTGAEAILILGAERYLWAPEYGGDTVGTHTLDRLRYGAFLHRHSGLPIYVTGGNPPSQSPPTGRLMAKVLEDEFGINAAGVEDRSRTTAENATFSAGMLERDGIHQVLLVTHAWHLPRAVGAFERVGITVTPAPTYFEHHRDERDYLDWLPDAKAFLTSRYALHEYLGQIWYQLKATLGTKPSAQGQS